MAIVLRGRTTIPVRCPDLSPLFLTLTQIPGGYSSHFGTRQSAAVMRTRRITQVLSFHILAHSFALFCKNSTLFFSIVSALFTKKHPEGGTSFPLLSRLAFLGSGVASPLRSLHHLLPYVLTSFSPYFLTSLLHYFLLSSTIAALPAGGKMSFSQRFDEIRIGFERPFWVANITELFERLSYYAVFASLARYLHHVLNFPTERATNLTGLFGGLVWFLAIFGGAIADRLGFRRALSLAYLILAGSYFLLGSI